MIDEITSSRINYMIKKNQMDFKPKLSNVRIRSKKENEQENEIKNITNLYDARENSIKFFEDYSICQIQCNRVY